MRRNGVLLTAVALGILAQACAKATGSTGPATTAEVPTTVQVTLIDNQKTVTLALGDTLVVDLPVPPKGSGWTLLSWPKDILGLPPVLGGPARFPYTFIAGQSGEGRIVAVNRTGCDGTRAAAGPACAAAPDLAQLRPDLLFVVTVHVSG